ncbi:hypothetical protein QTP86_012431 [Hemibagrus guttatus]|nr:hypothetical protein QTP86_012431 [Hemibagrus guttatus]
MAVVVNPGLDRSVAEWMIFHRFSYAGHVESVRICRDRKTGASLGYAYVNFRHQYQAEQALEMLNFEPLLDRPMHVMWSEWELMAKRIKGSNIFIQNLDESIDSVALFDTFSEFGRIVSCKVVELKGYGYIQYDSAEAAALAIEKLNGMLLNDREITIEYFKPREERKAVARPSSQHQASNLFIKNLDSTIDDECLRMVFGQFGTIISAKVMTENGRSKGFGFVSFKSSQEAELAKNAMNGRMWGRKQIYVGEALRKEERQARLAHEKAQGLFSLRVITAPQKPAISTAPSENPVQAVSVISTAPTEDSVQSVPATETAPVEDTVQAVPAIETVPSVDTVTAIETVPSEDTVAAIETVPSEDTVAAIETVPSEDTVAAIETVPSEDTVAAIKTVPSEDPVQDVPANETAPVEDTVQAVPAIETVPSVDTVAAIETVPSEDTVTAIETVPSEDTVAAIETVPSEDTVAAIETVPSEDTVAAIETVPSEDTVAAIETVPSEDTVAAIETVPSEDTVAAIETVPSEDTVAAIETVPSEDTVAAIETVSSEDIVAAIETVPSVDTVQDVPVFETVPSEDTVQDVPVIEVADTAKATAADEEQSTSVANVDDVQLDDITKSHKRFDIGVEEEVAFGCSLFGVATADQLVRTTTWKKVFFRAWDRH